MQALLGSMCYSLSVKALSGCQSNSYHCKIDLVKLVMHVLQWQLQLLAGLLQKCIGYVPGCHVCMLCQVHAASFRQIHQSVWYWQQHTWTNMTPAG